MLEFNSHSELPALDEPCSFCQGAGVITNPAFEPWWVKHKDCILTQYSRCDPKCANPEHAGEIMPSEKIICVECEGRKVIPTETGKFVLDFLGRMGFKQSF